MGVIRPAHRNCQSTATATMAKTSQRLEDAKAEVEALKAQNEALKADMANALSDVQPKKSR